MKISCDIIRDVLPLYAENMVSSATREMVDNHLCECDACTKELGALKKAQAVPVDLEIGSLKRVGNTIRRRRILTVAAALMTLAAIVVTGMTLLLTPYVLTYEEAIEGVEVRDGGALVIDFARGVNGQAGWGVFDNENFGILCHTNRYDMYQARKMDAMLADMSKEEIEAYIAELYGRKECSQEDWDRFFGINADYGTFRTHDGEDWHNYDPNTWTEENGEWVYKPAERNHWYLDPSSGDVETIIWDAGKDRPQSVIWTTTSGYMLVFWSSLILGMLCLLISGGITGIWKEILIRLAMVLGSLAVSTLMVTGGKLIQLEHHMSHEWIPAIQTQTFVLTLTALVWYQLHQLNKQAKGM